MEMNFGAPVHMKEDLHKYPECLRKYITLSDMNGGPDLYELEIALAYYVLAERASKEENDAFDKDIIVGNKHIDMIQERLKSARPDEWIFGELIDAVAIALTQL